MVRQKTYKGLKIRGKYIKEIGMRSQKTGANREKEYALNQELLFSLQELSQFLTSEKNIDDVLTQMAKTIGKAIKAKYVNFWLLDEARDCVYIKASYGMAKEYIKLSREQGCIRRGEAYIGRAIVTKTTWATSDVEKDPEFPQQWIKMVRKQGVKAIMCTPFIVKDKSSGGICVYHSRPHEYTNFEMRLITVAANQAATAVENFKILQELTAEQQKTASMINSMHDGIILYDLEGKIVSFNPRSEELLWVKREDAVGKDPSSLPSDQNPLLKNVADISSLLLSEFETREIKINDPKKMILSITNLPVKDTQNRKIGSMKILHDLTSEKEVEEMKVNFISIASHQLRSPLSGIKWAIDMLLEENYGQINKNQRNLLTSTFKINEHLISLVNDLLDTSRIEEGRFGYNFEKVDVFALIKKIIAEFETQIKEKRISIAIKKGKKPLSEIHADPNKIKMAIDNIIDNAIKYTHPKDSINISVNQGESTLLISIKDNGIGIPKDQQKFVFVKFFRARNAIRLQTEGSGLGLWIANEIVKHHNGKISFESIENKGSTFNIQFPADPKLMPKLISG